MVECNSWDFAGVDGLQAAMRLFTPAAGRIAPFQSFSAALNTEPYTADPCNAEPCAVLRLCENNFRVVLPKTVAFGQVIAALGLNVWCQPSRGATLMLPAKKGLMRLAEIATTKPIYQLEPFPCNRAVPARIHGSAILAWHYSWDQAPVLRIQSAAVNFHKIRTAFLPAAFSSFDDLPE